MDVAGGDDRNVELFAKGDDAADDVLDHLFIFDVIHFNERLVHLGRMHLKKIVKAGDVFDFLRRLLDQVVKQLAFVAARANEQPFTMLDQHGARDARHAVKIIDVRQRDELEQVFQPDVVLRQQRRMERARQAVRRIAVRTAV